MSDVSGSLVQTDSCPVKTTINQVKFGDSPITLLITKYSNRTQLIITETGKSSVIYQVTKIGEHEHLTFEINCVLGVETEESLVAARILSEQFEAKSVTIAFGLKNLSKDLKKDNLSALINVLKEQK